MKKRTIWTWGYFPMTMGGSCNRPISTEVGLVEEKSIGKGYKAFSFYTPRGTTRIAESITGAIIGDSFEEVIADMKAAKLSVIKAQITEAQETVAKAVKMTKEKFFKLYKS